MIKTLLEYRRDDIPEEVRKRIDLMLFEMKKHANPEVDLSLSETICYNLLDYIRKKVKDRACRILFYLLVLEKKNECFLSFEKRLYFEIETLILAEKEPQRSVLLNIQQNIKQSHWRRNHV